ncbi:MAG: hypothetical protein A2X42_05720 [Candidatus Margulisbacteria bacterium GWF2_38_17]|nr:MAG: hypothetical protein A2X42_05720 [Candidatus Margulisbacteria bacterium GWF2_38_17]
MITKKSLKNYIKEYLPYKNQKKESVTAWLIKYICADRYYEPASKLKDIAFHGCITGCVSELIYTQDCRSFYNKFEQNIWDIISEFRESTGQKLGEFLDSFNNIIEDEDTLKVYLCWFAVEQVAYQILSHFGEEF